jgi:signal transduction histidine kinase
MTGNTKKVLTDWHHQVQFYNNDAYLTEVLVRFVRSGLSAGSPVVVIATTEHYENLLEALSQQGFDPNSCIRNNQLICLDARGTLATFMVDGMPAEEAFRRRIGTVLDKVRAGRSDITLYAFGEMVDLLWRDGNSEAAIRLEQMWNDLAAGSSCSLLCAYAMGNFVGEAHSEGFERMCREHAHVIPTERYMQVSDEQTRLQEISILEQRARSLESEIKERKALERKLKAMMMREQAARTEAENASRLKDEFLAVVSHELKTPLNAILGWTQILDLRSDEKTVAQALEVIRRNAVLQLDLVNDLLDISRIITGRMVLKSERVDLGQVINASLETVKQAAAKKSIELKVVVKDPAPSITGDADRLQQVLWNLLSNAIKFTPNNGKVELHLEQNDEEIQVIVRDTGAGIHVEFLPYVFDRFRQADTGTARKVGGLGLGLAVVRYLVEAHGGHVSVESPGPGEGATFTVSLPTSVAHPQNAPSQVNDCGRTLAGCRIVVVDGQSGIGDLFRFILEDAGADAVVTASSGESLELVSRQSFDMVLVDIGSPANDGFGLVGAIREHPLPRVREIPVIAVASYGGYYSNADILAAGFDDYAVKPVGPGELERLVAHHLSGRAA